MLSIRLPGTLPEPFVKEEMSRMIHLLVLDDHSLFREGLIRLLMAESDFQIVGNCARIEEAREILDKVWVDMVLLDYDLGAEPGLQLLKELKSKQAHPKVLMVTAGMNSADMLSALQEGAAGVFLKHSPPAQLAEAIRRVADGAMWLDPRVVEPVVAHATRIPAENPAPSSLSPRENAVLRAVLEGATNKKIATMLHISESSVKAVLQQLFAKTGVRTRSQLVRLALERHTHDWLADDSDQPHP